MMVAGGGQWWPVVAGEMAARAEEALLSVCTGLALLVTGCWSLGFHTSSSRSGCTSRDIYCQCALGKTLRPMPPPPQLS